MIRDLKGTVEREKACIGALITLEPPSKPMIKEAVSAGFYVPEHFPGKKFPRIQILTVEDLLAGMSRLEFPRMAVDTYKKAKRNPKKLESQPEFL